MSWNPRKCFLILQNTPSPSEESNTAPLLIDNSPLRITQSHEYLGVTLSASGISTSKNLERADSASPVLQFLTGNPHFKTKCSLRDTSWILSTFVRSKYIYAIHHMPLLTALLEKDTLIQRKLFKTVLQLRQLPTKNHTNQLQGIFRICSLQMVRNCMINNLANRIRLRLQSDNPITRGLAERDQYIINLRSPVDHLRRALRNPQSPEQLHLTKFCHWNAARTGSRCPAPFQTSAWPPALSLPSKNHRTQVLAVRWHLGLFPIPNTPLRQLSDYTTNLSVLRMLKNTTVSDTQASNITNALHWFADHQSQPFRQTS